MGNYAAVLEGFGKLDGIKEAFILGDKGKLLETLHAESLDFKPLSRLVLSVLEASKQLSQKFGKGSFPQNFIEYKNLNITLDKLSLNRFLVITAVPGTNLGRIRYEIKRSKKLFEALKTQ